MKRMVLKSGIIMLLNSCLGFNLAFAQQMEVSGKVTDQADHSVIAGVTVVVRGTNTETVTDQNGMYRIQAKKGAKLVFTYLGYDNKEITVNHPVHNVALTQSPDLLEEVVVMSYASEQQAELSGVVVMDHASPAAFSRRYVQSPQPVDQEDYKHFTENRFQSAVDVPLSTFSIDVDAASYSNMRRFVNQGKKPDKDAIRIEELINYFSYNYAKPTGTDPVKITTEVGSCPWNSSHRLVRIGIKAKEIPSGHLPASNLVFLIDVSGSMYGPQRLDLVKSSLRLLVNNLREKDKVAIVVYAGAAGEVLPSTSGADKQKIREALDGLIAGGSTAGGAGIQLAYRIAKKNFIPNGNNRIILCTDGDFNVGVSANEQLESLIESERKNSNVFLTVLGYGMGNYKDSKMQVLAEKGNGNHAYIDNLQEANKVLVSEFGGTIHTVAKDVKLQVEFNPAQVQSYRLVGYESRLLNKEDFNDDTKDAGEMGAGHTVTAFYEVVPVGVTGNIPGKVDELKYRQDAPVSKKVVNYSPDLLTVKLRYKEPDKDVSKKIEQVLIDYRNNSVSKDFRFASSVAMFGQLLRDSGFKGDSGYDEVISLARTGLDNDDLGYRREFIRLVEAVKGM